MNYIRFLSDTGEIKGGIQPYSVASTSDLVQLAVWESTTNDIFFKLFDLRTRLVQTRSDVYVTLL